MCVLEQLGSHRPIDMQISRPAGSLAAGRWCRGGGEGVEGGLQDMSWRGEGSGPVSCWV